MDVSGLAPIIIVGLAGGITIGLIRQKKINQLNSEIRNLELDRAQKEEKIKNTEDDLSTTKEALADAQKK